MPRLSMGAAQQPMAEEVGVRCVKKRHGASIGIQKERFRFAGRK